MFYDGKKFCITPSGNPEYFIAVKGNIMQVFPEEHDKVNKPIDHLPEGRVYYNIEDNLELNEIKRKADAYYLGCWNRARRKLRVATFEKNCRVVTLPPLARSGRKVKAYRVPGTQQAGAHAMLISEVERIANTEFQKRYWRIWINTQEA